VLWSNSPHLYFSIIIVSLSQPFKKCFSLQHLTTASPLDDTHTDVHRHMHTHTHKLQPKNLNIYISLLLHFHLEFCSFWKQELRIHYISGSIAYWIEVAIRMNSFITIFKPYLNLSEFIITKLVGARYINWEKYSGFSRLRLIPKTNEEQPTCWFIILMFDW
jgi:hypothetical protein